MSKGCIIFKNGEIEDVFSEPLSLCSSPPFAYIEFVQLKKTVKNLSVVVTTNEFQNSCIFYLKQDLRKLCKKAIYSIKKGVISVI